MKGRLHPQRQRSIAPAQHRRPSERAVCAPSKGESAGRVSSQPAPRSKPSCTARTRRAPRRLPARRIAGWPLAQVPAELPPSKVEKVLKLPRKPVADSAAAALGRPGRHAAPASGPKPRAKAAPTFTPKGGQCRRAASLEMVDQAQPQAKAAGTGSECHPKGAMTGQESAWIIGQQPRRGWPRRWAGS